MQIEFSDVEVIPITRSNYIYSHVLSELTGLGLDLPGV